METIKTDFALSKEQLALLIDSANLGISERAISSLLEIGLQQLIHSYGEHLDANKRTANLHVYATLRRMASTGRNLTATLSWIKTQCPHLLPYPLDTKASSFNNNLPGKIEFTVYNNDGEPNHDY